MWRWLAQAMDLPNFSPSRKEKWSHSVWKEWWRRVSFLLPKSCQVHCSTGNCNYPLLGGIVFSFFLLSLFTFFFFFGCITYKKHLTLCLVHCKSSVLLFIFSIQHNTTCITHAPLWTPSNPGKRAFLTLKYISHLFLEVKNWLKGKKKLCLSSVSLFHPPWRKGKFL